MNNTIEYTGLELPLFEKARKWKKYFSSYIKPYINGRILEVGAGIGGNIEFLHSPGIMNWTLVEPDKNLRHILFQKKLPENFKIVDKTIAELDNNSRFDTILYIDVLEHIEQDKKEIETATRLLNSGGHLIVLSPAFQHLYSPFDKAIGHYRRYTNKKLQQLIPVELKKISLRYLDSLGYFASLSNRLFLSQQYPSQKQIHFWDTYLVPASTFIDKTTNHFFGKTILGIWQKQ